MNPDLESILIRGSRPRALWIRLGVALAALVANSGISSKPGLAILGGMGWTLLGVHSLLGVQRCKIPWLPLLAIGLSVPLVASISQSPVSQLEVIGLRSISGIAWIALLSSLFSWSDLRGAFRRWTVASELMDFIDSSIHQGFVLFQELLRRRDIAYLRLFRAGKKRLGVQELSWALAGGLDQAMDRIVKTEEIRILRTSKDAHFSAAFHSPGKDGVSACLRFFDVQVKGHSEIKRLDRCSFELQTSEWSALAGPSGSGKTTLLQAASGLTAISSGELIRLNQTIRRSAPLHRRVDSKVGFVLQDPYEQILGSTPLEDVQLGLRARGVPEKESARLSLEMLRRLGIGELAERPVSRLSYGERKRLAFAAVLVCSPALLLCDEPTAGLDPVAASRLIAVLESVSANNSMSVIWATHDLSRLPKRVGRVILLNRGRIVFDGPKGEALDPVRLRQAGLEEEHGGRD